MTTAALLAHTMDKTRAYTLLHLDKLMGQDLHRRFECEGKVFNTAYWLVAHIAVTQNGLLLMATGGPFEKFSWAKFFGRGGAGLPPAECPPFEEVLGTFHRIHEKAIAHVATLPDQALMGPNLTGLAILGPTVQDVIIHAIRHEGLHTGHLSWLCKLYGIPTM